MGSMRRLLKTIANRTPLVAGYIRRHEQLVNEHCKLRRDCAQFAPPGHYYSPLPCFESLKRDAARLYARADSVDVPAIDYRPQEQIQLLKSLGRYHETQPFTNDAQAGRRYGFHNDFFGYTDGIAYHCLLRHLAPRRVIEVGSGHSSCVLLDTNELFFDSQIRCTFIEPHPERLNSLLRPKERQAIEIVEKPVESIGPGVFATLQPGDILFIDSSHVSKAGSDVNHLFFEIMPSLPVGVHIHIHDIYHPFEYPRQWFDEGRAWNEAYLTRAFLMYNDSFRITYSTNYLTRFHPDAVSEAFPLYGSWAATWPTANGASLWLTRHA